MILNDLIFLYRFGRDYYINQSKVVSGERQERARSAMSSMSSRPSSSLSQQSSCTGDEQHERQVSHDELEQFEAASLRGSLPRRCCRDSRASPHFAINPLLHLKSASDRSRHGDDERAENPIGNDVRMMFPDERESTKENMRDDRESKNSVESNVRAIFEREEDNHVLAESLEIGTDSRKLAPADWNRPWNGSADREAEEPIVPRYDNHAGSPGDRDDRDPGDHDSGMCSIGSHDSETSDRDRWRQLYRVADNDRPGGDEQISSIGGRRFWTTGGYKYHTFGGIRIRSKKTEDLDDDLEDESASPEDSFEDRSLEFAKLKFQTFGGIKRSRRIPNFRRIRLRPILSEVASAVAESSHNLVETEGSANLELHSNVDHSGNCDQPTSSTSFEGFASFEHSMSSTFEESDWQDEDDVTNDRISIEYAQIGRNRNRTNAFRTKRRNLIRKKNVNSLSLWSLPNENDEWQDEIDCASDEIIMNKFLKDVSRTRKVCAFNDDDVRGRGMRSRKHREVLEDSNSEKLGKSITRRNTERNLESSKECKQEGKSDDKGQSKKLYVRSLSDITIW